MDDGPIVFAQCSNEYMIIDPSFDSTISEYFSSWVGWHYAINGPTKSDKVNWEEWYLPTDDNTIFFPTETCDTCHLLEKNNTKVGTAYYMNANLFGCVDFGRGIASCDWDFWTYECRACKNSEFADHIDRVLTHVDINSKSAMLGECGVLVEDTNTDNIAETYEECSISFGSYKPSIGTNGRFCVCTQPSEIKHYSVSTQDVEEKLKLLDQYDITTTTATSAQFRSLSQQKNTNSHRQKYAEEVNKKQSQNDIETYHLYQEDFEKGTYRILKSGIYIIEEDITFDFKANYDNPNSEGAWFPVESERDYYPGAGQSRDGYYLGFFAGITIETDNVILDLNGHTLQQSFAFSIQQGFFALIECGSQPFLPGQGIGFFGANPQLPSDITIMNGQLGLTSHHGIHGNYNKNVIIKDLKITDFTTHGLQFNGFQNLVISNVEVGPSTQKAVVTAAYSHARAMLPVARALAEDETTNSVVLPFAGRVDEQTTMVDIYERLLIQMDMVFNHLVNKVDYENSKDETIIKNWKEAKSIFIKDDGIPYGSAMYGIFLNYPGSSIQSYHLNHERSNHVSLDNVYIHDLNHKTKEALGLKTGLRNVANAFNAPFEATQMLGVTVDNLPNLTYADDAQYVGNALQDFFFGMYRITDNWDYLGLTSLAGSFDEWVFGETKLTKAIQEYRCNVDSMGHPTKGLIGLRLDGVNNASIRNVVIENLIEGSELGSKLCGEYDASPQTQRLPFQTGYSGNMLQGISIDYSAVVMNDITVQNLESKTGLSVGISFWYGSEVKLNGDIDIYNINAGTNVKSHSLTYDDSPNRAPEACAIRVPALLRLGEETKQSIDTHSANSINIECISGHIGCEGEYELTQIGQYSGCSSQQSSYFSVSNNFTMIQHMSNLVKIIIIGIIILCMVGCAVYYKYSSNEASSYTLLK